MPVEPAAFGVHPSVPKSPPPHHAAGRGQHGSSSVARQRHRGSTPTAAAAPTDIPQEDQEMQADPLPHKSELPFGLLAGTVTWGPPQQVEVSGSILGGLPQVATQIPVNYL
jgi:hypothetical protein